MPAEKPPLAAAANQKNSISPDDYSPEATLITFDRPIPLLRRPIPTAAPNEPFILGFKNPQSWANAYKTCESQIIEQCEAGARIGCSVSASRKCAPPWWKSLTGGGATKEALIEREKCEEREMAECLEASRSKCREFAKDKCLPAFRDARILVKGGVGDEKMKALGLKSSLKLDLQFAEEVICWSRNFEEKSAIADFARIHGKLTGLEPGIRIQTLEYCYFADTFKVL